MAKNRKNHNKKEELQTFNPEETLNPPDKSLMPENQNQTHNARKEGLGPNTKR